MTLFIGGVLLHPIPARAGAQYARASGPSTENPEGPAVTDRPKKAKPDPKTLYDINVCAPEFFTVSTARANTDGPEFVRRAEAFYHTMYSLDRAVMLCYDPDRRCLYLASVEQSPNV